MRFRIGHAYDAVESGVGRITEECVLAYHDGGSPGMVYRIEKRAVGSATSINNLHPRGFYGDYVYTSAGRAEGSDE